MSSPDNPPDQDCSCFHPPFFYEDYESTEVGTDLANNRYGEVTIEKCKKCKRLWLRYLAEYEAFPKSGRWYRGLISSDGAKKITAKSAVKYLEKLDWCFYGGSFFDTTGKVKTDHSIQVDL